MFKKIILLYLGLIFFIFNTNSNSLENKILIKSENQIITSIDINNEYKYFYYGPPRKRKFWINLVLSKSEYYLEKELIINRLDKNSTLISIMLGYFGELKYLSNKDSVMNSLDNTIKILSHSSVPLNKKVTYASFACDYQPLKEEKW